MIKIYDFVYSTHEAEASFKVDTEIFTEEMAKETLEFFAWDNDYDHDGDPIDEVLKKYAIEAIWIATRNRYNTLGVTRDFEENEGFCNIDGSFGIELLHVSGYELDDDALSMTVTAKN